MRVCLCVSVDRYPSDRDFIFCISASVFLGDFTCVVLARKWTKRCPRMNLCFLSV